MKKTELKVIRYEITDKFFVEVMQGKECTEFWLCHTEYAIKDFMFGMRCSEEEYEEYIEANVFSYIPLYLQDREREELDNE